VWFDVDESIAFEVWTKSSKPTKISPIAVSLPCGWDPQVELKNTQKEASGSTLNTCTVFAVAWKNHSFVRRSKDA
jgi:hypothetical protein